MRIHRFKESVLMSTYVVAFAITDYDFIESQSSNNVSIRFWAPKENLSTEILEGTRRSLELFENLLHYDYPLEKLDVLSLPPYLGSRTIGMENWGLITINETYLNEINEKPSSMRENAGFPAGITGNDECYVVAHEVAHMWFGNLITPKDWKDLWLSEGVTSFFHAHACEREDEENVARSSLGNGKNWWRQDMGPNPKYDGPLRINVEEEEDVKKQLNMAQYLKGAGITNMIKAVVGPEKFMAGIRKYIRHYAFKNVDTEDFVNSLDPQLLDFVDSWTQQAGYPVLDVQRAYDAEGTVEISQRPYPSEQVEEEARWDIPFTVANQPKDNATENGTITAREIHWLRTTNQAPLMMELTAESEEWIVVDPDVDGFYTINYDEKNWHLIIDQLESDREVFSPHLRMRLLRDAWHLTQKDLLSPAICLRLLSSLGSEDNEAIWDQAYAVFEYFIKNTDTTPFGHRLHAMIRSVIDERMGRSGENGLTKSQRKLACLGRHEICYQKTPWLEDVAKFLQEYGS